MNFEIDFFGELIKKVAPVTLILGLLKLFFCYIRGQIVWKLEKVW